MARVGRTRAAGDGAATQVVPGYRLSRPLGGGSGRVFSASADATGRAVIVSVVEAAAGHAGAAVRRRLEGLVTSPHAHLPKVLDVVPTSGDGIAIVTEVVPGASLASVRVARGTLTLPEVAGVLADVGSALAHLAAAGVVHGDVSPANVVVDTTGRVVLVDLVGDVTVEQGTPGHVAPERRAGGPASTSADVWALGTMVRALAPGNTEVEALTAEACADDPAHRPTARALAARAAELGGRAGVRLPAGADMASALLREGALREATTHVPRGRLRGGRRGRRRASGRRPRAPRPAVFGAVTVAALVLAMGAVHLARGAGAGLPAQLTARVAAEIAGKPAATGDASAGEGPAGAGPAGVGEGGVGPGAADAPRTAAGNDQGEVRDGTSPAEADQVGAVSTAEAFMVVARLIDRREQALLDGDTEALTAGTVPGSAARAADEPLVGALAGTSIEDLDTEVTSVVLTDGTVGHGRFTAEVTLSQAAWRAVGAAEEVIYPATTACSLITLVLIDPAQDSWAAAESLPCGQG